MTIKKILKYIDCTDYEIKTFVALLDEEGGSGVLKLSKKLNAPRATIYGHLDSLIEKGLVKKGLTENGNVFYAEDLEVILGLYDEKINEINQAKVDFKKLIASRRVQPSHSPKFTLYETPQAAELIFRNILRSREHQTYWFWPLKEMVKTIPSEALINFHQERIRRGIWLNIICPEKFMIKMSDYPQLAPFGEKTALRRIKVLKGNIDQFTGYGIYGTKVAFISSRRENYGFVIDSKELSQTLKSQFNYLWEIAKK